MDKGILKSERIIQTIEKLRLRIEDRFPDSGLLQVAGTLLAIAQETDQTVRWIERPNYSFRLLSLVLIALIIGGLVFALSSLDFSGHKFDLADLVSLSEAAINELILIGAAIVFIATFEVRRKRKRVITALNRLRSIAHVIDAHQLTKDPDAVSGASAPTKNSPARTLSPYELSRYLDYCAEMFSLTGKVAFLHVQKFDDPVALNAVNDLENLTAGLSRKVWQKIMILKDAMRHHEQET